MRELVGEREREGEGERERWWLGDEGQEMAAMVVGR
jgi:hypothetical protein